MHIDFEPGKLINEVKTHLPDVTDLVFKRKASEAGMNPSELLRDLVCELVHGAPYLDLLLQHRREARETQAKSDAEPRPNVRPITGLKADVVPVAELQRQFIEASRMMSQLASRIERLQAPAAAAPGSMHAPYGVAHGGLRGVA